MDGGNIGILIFKPARGGSLGGGFGRKGLAKPVLLVVLGRRLAEGAFHA